MIDLGSTYPAAVDVLDGVPVPGSPDGTFTNAVSVVLTITQPDGTTVTPAVANPPALTGKYRLQWPPTMAGRHLARWQTTSPQVGYTDSFDVAEAAPPMFFSLASAKRQLGMDPADHTDDEDLREMLMGIGAAIENYKHEVIVQRQFTEQATITGPAFAAPLLRIWHVPVIQLVQVVALDGSVTYDTTGMRVSSSGLVTVVSGPPVRGTVLSTVISGYRIIPYNYVEGAKVLLQALWESRRGPGGLSGVIGPEELADFRHYTSLPRKVTEWLGPQKPVVA